MNNDYVNADEAVQKLEKVVPKKKQNKQDGKQGFSKVAQEKQKLFNEGYKLWYVLL